LDLIYFLIGHNLKYPWFGEPLDNKDVPDILNWCWSDAQSRKGDFLYLSLRTHLHPPQAGCARAVHYHGK
jgi:hypothetical protein